MVQREIFRKWCALRNDIPLFLRADWLDTITDETGWDVVLVGKENDVQAFLPYFKKRKLGFDIITMPPMTPYLGPWLHYPEGQKQATRLAFEKKMMEALIDQLPPTDRFVQYFHPQVTNWLPFQWKGFTQTTRYTYILNDLSDVNAVYDGFQGNIKREIKKAEAQHHTVQVQEVSTLYALLRLDYAAKGKRLPISEDYLTAVHRHLQATGRGVVFLAQDDNGTSLGSLLLAWDTQSAYFLAGAADPKAKTTGVMSLLLWEAIRHASTVTHAFNFEGSMIEPIERFFRAFGGVQTPYFEVRATKSKLLRLI